MIRLNFPLVLFRRLKNDFPPPANFPRRSPGHQPAIADPAHPPGRRRAAPANPHRRRGLKTGFRRNADLMAGKKPPLVGNALLLPQAAHQGNRLVRPAAAVALRHAAGFILLRLLLPQPHRRKAAAFRQKIQGGNLFRQHYRIPQRQGQNAGAELQPLRPGRHHRQSHQRLQAEPMADDAVAEPDRIVFVAVAQLHQLAQKIRVLPALAISPRHISDSYAHNSSPAGRRSSLARRPSRFLSPLCPAHYTPIGPNGVAGWAAAHSARPAILYPFILPAFSVHPEHR